MTVSKLFKFNRKTIVHAIVLIVSIFSLYVTADNVLKHYESLLQGGFYDAVLFVFTIYFIALVIIPLLFKNWKKYLYIAISFIVFYSLLLGWMRAIRRSSLVMLRKGIFTEALEYFTLDSVLNLSLTLIPMGVMGLFYYVFVMDWEKLKRGFFQKNTERIINAIVVVLIMLYVSIMPAGTKTDELLFVSFFILFFYINSFYITPILFISKNKLRYAFITVLWFVTLYTIFFSIIYLLDQPLAKEFVIQEISSPSIYMLRLGVMVFIPNFLTSFAYGYIRIKIKKQDKILEAKESELSLLKSQVNPHFLFNTLNTLYSTALEENAPKTAESTAKLASLIRYMQEDINKDFIPLENEIKYLQDYITIQKLRCAVEPEIETKFNSIENHKISPGLLIPFVENAFKYGINPSKKSKLFVSVICNENTIYFECINSYDENFKTYYKEQGFGIGIKNAKERLELVYPKKHTVEIKKESNIFSVKINITIK